MKRSSLVLALLLLAAPAVAQGGMGEMDGGQAMAERPIPAGEYTFVPEESEEIEGKIREAVSHMFFAIRGIARGRLAGANRPIDRVDIQYRADTVMVSLREDEPTVKALLNGDTIPFTRADGEVVQVTLNEVADGLLDMYFISEDGEKEMIFQIRNDGMLAVESITYSEKLEEPFRYTWVYAAQSSGMSGDGMAAAEGTGYQGKD